MGYRLDIQLLRAFAVIVVVLYHLEVPFFSKGFLGVDVFFVISGFLMAVLYKDGQAADFFKRRIRRLLPPYIAVLVATIAAGILLLLPNELYQLNEQSIYSLLFSANIGFWSENSYFSSSSFRPLLHLWSLGVEVQYYLFVPLIVWLFRKHKSTTVVLALGSILLCAAMLHISPKTSFFMMPLRAWEFLIGAIAGLYFTNGGAIRNQNASWLGLAGIVSLIAMQAFPVSGEHFNFVFGHPGLAALLTCFATMMVIVFGLPSSVLESKSARPFIYVGKISYSVYLVHFPVIVFYLYEPFSGTILSPSSSIETLTLISLILALSLICYNLIEKPGPKINQVLLASAGSVSVIALVVVSTTVISNRFDSYELGFLLANEDRAVYRCGKMMRISDPSAITCLLNTRNDHEKSVLLVGNSHADSIKIEFSKVADSHGYNTHFVVANNPLMPGGPTIDQIVSEAESKSIDIVVTHHSPGAITPQQHFELQQALSSKNIPLIVIAPIPVYEEHIPRAIFQAYQSGKKELTLQTRSQHLAKVSSIFKMLTSIQENSPDHFTFYDPSIYLCKEHCWIMDRDGKAWYFDDDHLTLSGAEQLNPLFKELFRKMESYKPTRRTTSL